MQSNYLILPRKYRPSNFAELQGQDALVKILTYATINHKLATAYLFTGSHGVGKTTTARILAKIINCTNPTIKANEINACNQCTNCLLIKDNVHPDILEIDAASHTGVEDIRIITDSIIYPPTHGNYRIFIIDEIHMLSKNAFNALLKTLEEPPSKVIFIFATTEVNKLPLTILSRCQRFDLRKLSITELHTLLQKICAAEQLKHDEQALRFIAQCAEGSARDALSLLDQAYTFAISKNTSLGINIIEELLSRASQSTVVGLLQAILQGELKQVLPIIAELNQVNTDFILLCQDVLELISYLSKLKVVQGYSLSAYASYHSQLLEQVKSLTLAKLTHLWQIFTTGLQELKGSFDPVLTLEMICIKAVYLTTLPSPYQLIQTLVDSPSEPKPSLFSANSASNQSGDFNVLGSLLTFIYKKRDLATYYYLMNQVEIVSLTKDELSITGESLSAELKAKLQNLLKLWSNNTAYTLSHTLSTTFTSSKQKIATEFTNSEAYHKITKAFQEAQLTSITLDLQEE